MNKLKKRDYTKITPEEIIAGIYQLLENTKDDYRDRVSKAMGRLDFYKQELARERA